MSPVRKTRARARVHSVNWRMFGWVLQREAALHVLFFDVIGTALEPEARDQILQARTDHLRRTVGVCLASRAALGLYPTAYDANGELSTTTRPLAAESIHVAGPPCALGSQSDPATTEPPATVE